MSAVVANYQKALKADGLYKGAIDGQFGPLTLAGAFQLHGDAPPWAFVAAAELGVSEVLGRRHNPRILEYHQATSLGADEDEVPWCASFVNWCLKRGGSKGTGSASARSFDSWGKPVSMRVGAVVTTPTKTGSLRHVAFLAGWTVSHAFFLGGNQANRVSVVPYNRKLVVAMRWPTQ